MSVINVNLEISTVKYIDVDGEIVVEIYANGQETPIHVEYVSLYEVAKDFVDIFGDSEGIIELGTDESEAAYAIIDELQDVIDLLNGAIEDPEEFL